MDFVGVFSGVILVSGVTLVIVPVFAAHQVADPVAQQKSRGF
jgi:hypothetical protein